MYARDISAKNVCAVQTHKQGIQAICVEQSEGNFSAHTLVPLPCAGGGRE